MVEFCPECSNLLRKEVLEGKSTLTCKCGYQRELEQNIEEINKIINKKKKYRRN